MPPPPLTVTFVIVSPIGRSRGEIFISGRDGVGGGSGKKGRFAFQYTLLGSYRMWSRVPVSGKLTRSVMRGMMASRWMVALQVERALRERAGPMAHESSTASSCTCQMSRLARSRGLLCVCFARREQS